jgi:glycosyltransferase involved in cell wall biosynthesis
MLSGVPILALRRGSVPEIVEHGLTGAICNSTDELVQAAKDAHRFDRASVRARALRRFTAARMAANYLAVYRKILLEAGQSAGEEAVEKVGA